MKSLNQTKMKVKKIHIVLIVVLTSGIVLMNGCRSIRNLTASPEPWSGPHSFTSNLPVFDAAKKTVFVMADYQLTEIFDLLAPFIYSMQLSKQMCT
jgi:uncharacterized protein YceK